MNALSAVLPAWSAVVALAPSALPASREAPTATSSAVADTDAAETPDLRAGAWDRSLGFEAQGDLQRAEAELIRGWGTSPATYDVAVRLAWLAYRQARFDEAVSRYEKARSLSGASQDATRGLAFALVERAAGLAREGETPAARADLEHALHVVPAFAPARAALESMPRLPEIEPAVWTAYLETRTETRRTWGGALFGDLALRLTARLSARVAYRRLEVFEPADASAVRPRFGAGTSDTTARSSWDALYAGAAYQARWFGAQAMGAALWRSDAATTVAAASRQRIGHRFGVVSDEVYASTGGAANVQVAPAVYFWPTERLGLSAGARVTWQQQDRDTSATAGLSWVSRRWALHATGHIGGQRAAFSIDGAALLMLPMRAVYGAAVTGFVPLGRSLRAGAQIEVEHMQEAGARGDYLAASLGLVGNFPLPGADP